ncbi:protein kinase domain-containing protein [Limnoglobus roseus]|uniref:Serine/threonine protein kinase n=1 Tax=Limnoglobus roseus TaxID=2598579 RepID=A0A5C1AC96_9BACT|nr:protein kinase [Limnoglobus roseus]QEL16215.1 serine/threonine protein kinase [Limnoglobus roseus]
MPRVCPSCDRSLADESDARFCMFCGARLEDTRIHGLADVGDSVVQSPTLILEPIDDSDATADYRTASAVVAPAPDAAPPERIGSYRLLRKLGTGGMGQVFEAESDDGGERVALKLLSPKLVTNPTSVERFKQEGRLASQISHPRCVFVYGVDAEEGRPFIVMELMPGSTLKDLVDKRGPLNWDRAVHRMLDVLDGLIEAHRLGMLHRDVKPSNCFLTDDDRVKVGDFGLSKSLDNQSQQKQLTSSGAFLGTVLFASPEQIRGEELGYDSDVYSVAATLYYLIVGRAPHHHISMTAALAKVISEPPPSIRSQRPDVPRAVERVVFRGLERDRNRRFGSLEEFRDALHDILPEKQLPSRVRTLVSAYLLDVVFCLIVLVTPVTWAYEALTPNPVHGDWLFLLVLFCYFTVAEGAFGATIGKLLFRLRTTRLGRVGPPGLKAGVIRTGVFHILVVGLFVVTSWTFTIPVVGAFVAGMVFLAGSAGLLFQRRYSPTRQGVHDYAGGCRVVQRWRRQHRPWLTSQFRNPLDQPKSHPNMPASVGGFLVLGILDQFPDGSAVWVAEDEALRRRILLWLRPAKLLPDGLPPSPVRPGRLRVISTGELVWNDGAYGWVAFVAPTGAPLVDVVTKEHPLSWADARMVLEQVVTELRDSDADSTTPARLGVDQLWVEPNGRIHLLEFPVPSARTKTPLAANAIELVRHVAAVTLEGGIHPKAKRIASPLSPQAIRITDQLFDAEQPPTLAAVRQQLKESHAHPPEVSGGMRAAHVGLILAISGWALVFLVLGSIGFSVQVALEAVQRSHDTVETMIGLSSPTQVEQWRASSPYLKEVLAAENLPGILENLRTQHDRDDQLGLAQRALLSRPERFVADSITRVSRPLSNGADDPAFALSAETQILLASLPRDQLEQLNRETRRWAAWRMILFILGVAFAFAAFAFAFRGGVSYLLAGIALVGRDGRAAPRWACALREFLIWLPLFVVLVLNIGIQANHPDWLVVRLALVVLTVVVLLAYLLVGLRYSSRGPHDELMGTYMVPA